MTQGARRRAPATIDLRCGWRHASSMTSPSLDQGSPTPPAAPSSAWFRLKSWFGGERAATRGVDVDAALDADDANTADPARPQLADYDLKHVIARNDRTTVHHATRRSTGEAVAL